MSYEKVIGFGINPVYPKQAPLSLTSRELDYFDRLDVLPIFHDLRQKLPENNKEPEPKIILSKPSSFGHIRGLLASAQNAFIIPGQAYQDKNPLTSILLDTVENGFPTARLDRGNYTLRYRFKTDPVTGMMNQGDFNEKSGLKGASMIGGCADRFERELKRHPGESIEKAYGAFLNKYRTLNDPAFCDRVDFNDFRVFAGYQAARNEIGFAVKHPDHNVLFVFEGCEDFWHVLDGNMGVIPPRFYEFEAEVKQVWGVLPSHVRNQQDMKHFVYSTLTQLRDYIHANTPGSTINLKSKAEIAKDHLSTLYETNNFLNLGLSHVFMHSVPKGYAAGFDPIQQSLYYGQTLDETLSGSARAIQKSGAWLHHEKNRFNMEAIQPAKDVIGHGSRIISFRNDNIPPPPPPLARGWTIT